MKNNKNFKMACQLPYNTQLIFKYQGKKLKCIIRALMHKIWPFHRLILLVCQLVHEYNGKYVEEEYRDMKGR